MYARVKINLSERENSLIATCYNRFMLQTIEVLRSRIFELSSSQVLASLQRQREIEREREREREREGSGLPDAGPKLVSPVYKR
jgi:hypothetical protein